jgi:hypothetical protein
MDKRGTSRFDKVFPVWVSSPSFGECQGIARNISTGGIFLELREPLPLGSEVNVHFSMPDCDGELVARGQVRRHYFLQFGGDDGLHAMTGMGVRFTGFEANGEERFGESVALLRTLH